MSPAAPPVTRPASSTAPLALLLIGSTAAGYAYGALTAALPAPHEESTFWVGNFAAPYLLLPFLAGAWAAGRGRAWPAALAGGLTAGAAIAGFYGLHLVGGNSADMLGLPPTTPAAEVAVEAFRRWFSTFLLGRPGGIPWLTIAAVVGTAAGLAGWLHRARGVRWAGLAVAGLVVAEPLFYVVGSGRLPMAARYDLTPWNLAVWGAEALVGLALAAVAVRAR